MMRQGLHEPLVQRSFTLAQQLALCLERPGFREQAVAGFEFIGKSAEDRRHHDEHYKKSENGVVHPPYSILIKYVIKIGMHLNCHAKN